MANVKTVNDNSEKPNIYIYPDIAKNVIVRFNNPEDVSVSDPQYPSADGWHVHVDENGAIDGQYCFLYYESFVQRRNFQFSNGWQIPAETRREEMEKVLRRYSFNDAEIIDFLEYWDTRLEKDTDYTMFPQETGTVDLVMPVHIEPAPDSIHRIWFVFSEDFSPYVTEPVEVESIIRKPYTVVEWGGIVD